MHMNTRSNTLLLSRTRAIVRIALLSAILFSSQVSLSAIPNVEVVSLLVVCYTLAFGAETYYTVTVFAMLETLAWGFGLWSISYFYVWSVLVTVVLLLKKILKEDMAAWSVVLGLYGLGFGFLFAIIYLVVDPSYMLTYWIAGLPWDIWHAITNIVITVSIGKPLLKVIKKCSREM